MPKIFIYCLLLGTVAAVGIVSFFTFREIRPHAGDAVTAPVGTVGGSPSQANASSPFLPATPTAKPSRDADIGAKALTEEEILLLPDENPDYPTFGHRVTEISARRNGQPVDVAALYAASQQKSAWEPTDTASDALPLSDEERLDGREFIKINPLKIESLVAGDTLEIEIAQNKGSYTARIDSVQTQLENNVSWFGHLEGESGTSGETQVYFTRGENLLTGGITTPDGHFELEARGGDGWIASSATLFKKEDVLIPVSTDELKRTPSVSSEALAQKGEPLFLIKSTP